MLILEKTASQGAGQTCKVSFHYSPGERKTWNIIRQKEDIRRFLKRCSAPLRRVLNTRQPLSINYTRRVQAAYQSERYVKRRIPCCTLLELGKRTPTHYAYTKSGDERGDVEKSGAVQKISPAWALVALTYNNRRLDEFCCWRHSLLLFARAMNFHTPCDLNLRFGESARLVDCRVKFLLPTCWWWTRALLLYHPYREWIILAAKCANKRLDGACGLFAILIHSTVSPCKIFTWWAHLQFFLVTRTYDVFRDFL